MSVVDRVRGAIREYHEKYRNPQLAEPSISDLYFLEKQPPDSVPKENEWPATFPYASRPGVYVFLDTNGDLLYVGRADNLGTRVSSYFRYGKDKACEAKDTWHPHPPYSLLTVAVTERFEASSLEEFLIGRLDPPVNKKGKRDLV